MTRRRRTDLNAPILHVFSRGADRQDIFLDDHDRALFELLLGDVVERFGLEIHAYALMDNHVHLVVDRSGADVSGAMQHLFARYARHFNDRTDRTGPLFTGRFGCTEVDSTEQHVQCTRYVHRNPLSFVPIEALPAYRWSSLPVYAGRRTAPDWLSTHVVPTLLHNDRADYVQFVLRPQKDDDARGVPLRPWAIVTLDEVDAVVRRTVPGAPPTKAAAREARLLAIGAATALRVASPAAIRDHHQLGSTASVRSAARRTRALAATNEGFARLYGSVIDQLRTLTRTAGIRIDAEPGTVRL